MGRIAIISTYFLGAATANGICAQSIAQELHRLGNDIQVICYECDSALVLPYHIHTVSRTGIPSLMCRIVGKIRKTALCLAGSINAVLDENLVQQYVCALDKINQEKPIETVVAMFFPLEAGEALRRFKVKNPDVKAILYELDSIGDGVSDTSRQKIYNRLYENWLKRVYQTVDSVFIMQSHEKYWKAKFGDEFAKKLNVADIPVLKKPEAVDLDTAEQILPSFIYAGLIERRYRSPDFLLAVLRSLHTYTEFSFSFYSRGDCEDAIAQTASEIPGIVQNGYVQQYELNRAIHQADFLVSIGNSVSQSVPSKVITYLSYGKPIIHFFSQNDDVCKQYFENYPLALLIDQSMTADEAAKLIFDFVSEAKGKRIDFQQIEKLFYLNSPAYSAELILNSL